MIGVLAYLGD
jgi:hypothetical protein